MKRAIAALCSSVALVGGAAAAQAHTTHIQTTILTDFVGPIPPSTVGAFGHLNASPRCRGDRLVKVFFRHDFDAKWTLVDSGQSSGQGAWGGIGPEVGPLTLVKARVLRENIGRHGHKHICEPDTTTIPD
jgi:hypothetical protein